MKYWVAFILADGKIVPKETNTKDYTKMNVPFDAIGGILISLKGGFKLGQSVLNNIDISHVTYFGERYGDKGWVKTRFGTLIELPHTAKVIKL